MPESQPKLSVVIAAVNGYRPLAGCLNAIERIPERALAEVIVVDRCGLAAKISREFPGVLMLPVQKDATIPQMRSLGILASHGEWVVITEDHCEPHSDWFEKILEAAGDGRWDVIAGAVVNGRTARLVDWAAFFTEYSEYMAPRAGGENSDLPGMNTAYRRATLDSVPGLVQSAIWETFLHARLREAGARLYSAPDVLLDHCKSFGYLEFLTQRYFLARSFAGMRVRGASPLRRLAYGAASPALLGLLPYRLLTRIWAKGAHRRELLLASPILVTFMASWTVGELVGYLFGEGDASSRVE